MTYENLVAQAIDFNTDKCTLRTMEVSTCHAPGEESFKVNLMQLLKGIGNSE